MTFPPVRTHSKTTIVIKILSILDIFSIYLILFNERVDHGKYLHQDF